MTALRLYRLLVFLAGPILRLSLSRRAQKGREDRARMRERLGHASLKRPDAPLIWVHAASVGETISVLPLIGDILESRPAQTILLTTGTVTSAATVAKFQARHNDIRGRLRHQYAPLDRRNWVSRFLDHWNPDAAFWVESEIWPNMVLACERHRIPLIMINGRLSPRSFHRWRRMRRSVQRLLGRFSLLMAQDNMTAERLRALGLDDVHTPGNLKLDAPPLPHEEEVLQVLKNDIGARPVWLAASTHAGEESQIAEAHKMIAAAHPNALTLIAPRHPNRGATIAADLRKAGLKVAQRSTGDKVTDETQIYLLDTLGELGLFYRLVDIVLMGGTLIPHGGQNPIEAARLDCAILHGPHIENFQEMFDALTARQAVAAISDAATLASQVKALFENPAQTEQMADAASAYADAMSGTRGRVLELIAPYLSDPDTPPVPPRVLETHDG